MSATLAGPSVQYQVHSDLNRESLPQSNRDPQRKIWWANSLAASVLGVGIFLTKEPAEFVFRPVEPEAPMVIEVVQPQLEQLVQADRPTEDEVVEEVDVAVIQPVVVAADPSKVLFGVEVKGPTVTSADLRKVGPPPAVIQRPKSVESKGPVSFKWGSEGLPRMGPSDYPREAALKGETGTVTLEIKVDNDGLPESVSIQKSSGSTSLDRASRDWVRHRGRWPVGERRWLMVTFEFKL